MAKAPEVKLILHKRKKEDTEGYITLKIGNYNGKKMPPRSLGHKIPADMWDAELQQVKKGYSNYKAINNDISKKKADLSHELTVDSTAGKKITPHSVRNKLRQKVTGNGSFIQFFADYLAKMNETDAHGKKQYSEGYLKQFKVQYNRLVGKMGTKVGFADVTVDWLEEYERKVKEDVALTTLNTVMKRLKEVIDNAIDRGLIERPQIAGYSWPGYTAPDVEYLTYDQVESIANLVYDGKLDKDKTLKKIACYFVIECYSGIRFSDWTGITIEKLIHHEAFKVRATKNGEPIYLYLKYWPRLARMVYYVKENNIVFDLSEQVTNRLLKTLASKTDPTIPIELTTHIGRHTCATLLSELGYRDSKIAEVLGISEQTVKRYVHNTRKALREEQEKFGGL